MQKIVTHLWFDYQAEEAAKFYTSIFKNSKIGRVSYYGEAAAAAAGRKSGSVLTVEFELDGQDFIALNGGPIFQFSPAISLLVNCETQQEIDELWEKLSADKEAEQCGWLKDQYGVSWQIVPTVLIDLLMDPDHAKSERAVQAMLKMKKLDIAELKKRPQDDALHVDASAQLETESIMPDSSEQVLAFWFGDLNAQGMASETAMRRWWMKNAAFDDEIKAKFLGLHQQIKERQHEAWLRSARGRLAYIIVLDQFSRNMFRESAEMFASDAQALEAALQGIERGADREVELTPRTFYYLPLMHSEDLAIQNQCVVCFEKLRDELPKEQQQTIAGNLDFAIQHRDIIARFGRFPHRNQILKRQSTPEEVEFLRGPGSSF